MNWSMLGLVMLGGALGGGVRHLLGSFGAGLLFAWLQDRGAWGDALRAPLSA